CESLSQKPDSRDAVSAVLNGSGQCAGTLSAYGIHGQAAFEGKGAESRPAQWLMVGMRGGFKDMAKYGEVGTQAAGGFQFVCVMGRDADESSGGEVGGAARKRVFAAVTVDALGVVAGCIENAFGNR